MIFGNGVGASLVSSYAALTISAAFASPTERQDPKEHCSWLKVSSPGWTKRACCESLPGVVVLVVIVVAAVVAVVAAVVVVVALKNCWRVVLFCVYLGPWQQIVLSGLGVALLMLSLFWSLDASSVFWVSYHWTPSVAALRRIASVARSSISLLKNIFKRIFQDWMNPLFTLGRVLISWLQQIP